MTSSWSIQECSRTQASLTQLHLKNRAGGLNRIFHVNFELEYFDIRGMNWFVSLVILGQNVWLIAQWFLPKYLPVPKKLDIVNHYAVALTRNFVSFKLFQLSRTKRGSWCARCQVWAIVSCSWEKYVLVSQCFSPSKCTKDYGNLLFHFDIVSRCWRFCENSIISVAPQKPLGK